MAAATKKKTPAPAKKVDTKAGLGKKSGSARIYTDWTPARLRAAERAAEAGSLSTAVSICEWLLGDNLVASAIGSRVESLMGLEPGFEEGTGRRAKKAAKAMEADEDWWESYPESELAQIHTWGLMLGIAPAHHNWEARPDHGGRMLPKPTLWYPQTLEWSWQDRTWSVSDASGARSVVVAGDGEWILHTPYGTQRPWSYGLWRKLSRWVLLKQFAMGDWGRHSEKGSLLVATSPVGATKEQRQELAADLASSGEDPVIALANGFDLKLVEVEANTEVIYKSQIDMADKAIAILIRGANLSTDVQGGSRAAAETQKKTGDDSKLRFDAQSLTTTIHDQSLVWWAEFNFGDRKLAPWPMYPVTPEEDKGARALMLVNLGKALAQLDTLGFDFDLKAIQKEFGLTFVTGRPRETRVVAPPAPPVPPGKDGSDPADDDEEDDDEPAANDNAKPPKAGKQARALASGATAGVDGFVNGQQYVDRLVDESRARAAEGLADELEQVLALVDSIKSTDELEAKLRDLYKEQDPEKLAGLVERYLTLAQLAGRHAVIEDL